MTTKNGEGLQDPQSTGTSDESPAAGTGSNTVADEPQRQKSTRSFDPDFKLTSKDTLVERATSEYLLLTEGVNLIPVANGIYDTSTYELLDFSPEYVFLTKSPYEHYPATQDTSAASLPDSIENGTAE